MDGAAAAVRRDGDGNKPHDGNPAAEDSACPPTEDTERDGVFCCQDCGEAFREEAAYSEHRHQHVQGNVNSDKQFDIFYDAKKDREMANVCTLCSISFVEPSEFHSHMEQKHGETSQKDFHLQINPGTKHPPTYECPECGKCYGVYGHFLNHQRSHSQASKSVFHDLEHLKKKSFQCESCGRSYSRASALDAHRRCHEEKLVKARNRNSGDSFPTEESTVETKPTENQAEHQQQQQNITPEKLFKCPCGKEFTASMRLKTHQRFSRNSICAPEDMKDKPKKICSGFHCNVCDKAFSSHIALYNHQKWHAKLSNDPAKKYTCELCGKVFMTLTFYDRHQRTAHSDETPAKSFLHQVCQLQKKAFECKDCGLKFSRASALQAHQLHHTENFRETEKPGQTFRPPQHNSLESERKETEQQQGGSKSVHPISVAEEALHVNETDEEVESYEPGDFNVQVISASESEDEPAQDVNPDLELLCESDQEQKDDCDAEVSSSTVFSKPDMDLKIVQIDFDQADGQCAPIEPVNYTTEERFDCPDCYRWFTSASSLRVHRMWHSIRKRRQQAQGQSVAAHTCDTCGHQASSFAAHCSHIQQHMNQNTNNDVMYQTEGSEKRNLTCNECGKCFSRLSALVSHQLHHPKKKQFQCPDCMMSYSYAASLFNHMKNCSALKKENISTSKKEYNPKKTLLGPKIYHCEQCRKGFWSLGAYSHHKQNPIQCVDLMLRKGVSGSLHSVNGHSRSSIKVACPVCGRKFRHKGIMTLHMRKHENGNHKCELCNRSFRLFSSLLRHQVVHSEQLPPPIKSFQHQVEQLKKNTYSCPDCGKLFSRAKALQFHMKSHGYETAHSPSSPRSSVALEDLQCATCLAHFNNKASLKAHKKLCIKKESQVVDCMVEPSENDNLKNKSCMGDSTQQTSKKITVKYELKSEEQNLGNETSNMVNLRTNLKYKCKKCDRSFSVIGALNLHKRIHVEGRKPGVKPKLAMSVIKKFKQEDCSKGLFHCSDCGRRFMSNSALGSHKRWHREKKLSRSSLKDDDLKPTSHKTEGGPFQCNRCGKQFFNHCVLQRHQMFNPQCQTKTEPELDAHTRAINPELSCPKCKQTFVQHSLLAAHLENVHSKTLGAAHLQEDRLSLEDHVPGQVDVNFLKSESAPLTEKHKVHQCPFCSMTFAKARGLRAHKWQVHSKSTRGKNKIILGIKKPVAPSSEVSKTEEASVTENTVSAVESISVGEGEKKIRLDPSPVKLNISSGEHSSPTGASLEQKKVCSEVKPAPKQPIQTPDSMPDTSPSPARLSEHTAKCLYKCDKCGKAFQTKEQLGNHKTKAKSRPYCCALCCHGFWTENQLQQHLAWHDEVRCRLPSEVRFRLSTTLSSKPLKPIMPSADTKGKSFPSSSMNPDSLSHNSHKCQHCGKAFLSPSALQKHQTQHGNNDSYCCSICPRTFSEIQDLIDHHQECIGGYRRQSDAPAAVSSGDTNGLTCHECGATFSLETDFHQHYTEHALKQSNLTCKDCGLKFADLKVFMNHLHQHALEEEEEVERGENGENNNEEQLDRDGGSNMSSSLQRNPSDKVPGVGGASFSMKKKHKKVHSCVTCGKVYLYLSSYTKHLKMHNKKAPASKVAQTLNKHECPECGISFFRKARLLGHMRIHRSGIPSNSGYLRCDQCNKNFSSEKSWVAHFELHEQRPFWCLSCSKGFFSEQTLEKHLQSHSLKKHSCNICNKSFRLHTELKHHYNAHSGAKPFLCNICGKAFSHPGNMFSHRKKHGRVLAGSSGLPVGFKKPFVPKMLGVEKHTPALNSTEQEGGASMNELPGKENCMEVVKANKPCESQSLDSAGSDGKDEFRSETRKQKGEMEIQDAMVFNEHEYWEWECCVCDMGFDEVGKLHMHYKKHATGELPIPHNGSLA